MASPVKKFRSDRLGAAAAVVATLLWSSAFVSARYLLGDSRRIDPMTLVFFRFAIGAAVVFGVAKLFRAPLRLESAGQFRGVIPVAFFLYFLMSFLFFIGQRWTSATTSALFIESGPALLVIVWKLLCRRPTGRDEIAAVLLGGLGCMFVLNIISASGIHFGDTSRFGQLLLLCAAISWVIGSVQGRKLMNCRNPLAVTGWCQLVSALMMVPLLVIFHREIILPHEAAAWGAVLAMGIFPTALAFILWGYAMPRLELWKLSLIQNLTPVFTLAGAWMILDERLTWFNLIGMALVLTALAIPKRRSGGGGAGRIP